MIPFAKWREFHAVFEKYDDAYPKLNEIILREKNRNGEKTSIFCRFSRFPAQPCNAEVVLNNFFCKVKVFPSPFQKV